MPSEKFYIAQCKKQIEEKFAFGNGHGWKQRDLEFLSEKIKESSGVLLSLSTLKRIWKDEFDQTPHPTTLNALVAVLGYDNWQEFKIQLEAGDKNEKSTSGQRRIFYALGAMLIAFVVAILFILPGFNEKEKRVNITGDVLFTANKTVANGVPNTFIMKYDLSNVEADSFFIQQSWNELEKTPIDPGQEYFTTTYLYPGFHKAKLIANDSIIKREMIHVLTDGWFPLAQYKTNDPQPFYIKQNPVKDGVLSVDLDQVKKSDIKTDDGYILAFFNIRDFGNVSSSDFRFETRMKANAFLNKPCTGMGFTIIAEKHIYFLEFGSKGCEGYLGLKIGDTYQDGEQHDLSAFGTDVFQFQDIVLDVKDHTGRIYLNDELIREVGFKEDLGIIKGIRFSFAELGSVDYVRLFDHERQAVYIEEFDNDQDLALNE